MIVCTADIIAPYTAIGTTNILMKDFGFDPPNIANVVSVQDGVKLNVKFTAKEQ